MCKMTAPRHHKSSDRQLPTEGDGMLSAKVVYQVIKDQLPIGFSESDFLAYSTRYTFFPIIHNGVIVGAYANDGPIIHAAVLPIARGKWLSKRVLKWIDGIIKQHGKAKTTVEAWNHAGHCFVKRLGFISVGSIGDAILYEKRTS